MPIIVPDKPNPTAKVESFAWKDWFFKIRIAIKGLTDAKRWTAVAVTYLNDTVDEEDYYVGVDATAAAFTVYLPDSFRNKDKQYVIKRMNGGANAVTVAVRTAGDLIDGAANIVLGAQYTYVRVISDGRGNWNNIT